MYCFLQYKDIYFRDFQPEDLVNYRRWYTEETAWMQWDAPWKTKEEGFKEKALNQLEKQAQKPVRGIRGSLEICHKEGVHIGRVSSYYLDQEYQRLAIGIGIRESSYWRKGLGKTALSLWLAYLFHNTGRNWLFCETWSGNEPMIFLAKTMGFIVVQHRPAYQVVDEKPVHGYIFALARQRFLQQYDEVSKTLQP